MLSEGTASRSEAVPQSKDPCAVGSPFAASRNSLRVLDTIVRIPQRVSGTTSLSRSFDCAAHHFSISNNTAGEMLAEIAMRHRNTILGKTQKTATRNLRHLEGFMAEHSETLGWIPPRGGVTAFPRLLSGENTRPFCQAAADQGILLAPGDCWDAPWHFRLGFAAISDKFPEG
jgi:DNA-binding transcriptional MocR family regulator